MSEDTNSSAHPIIPDQISGNVASSINPGTFTFWRRRATTASQIIQCAYCATPRHADIATNCPNCGAVQVIP